jgi:hypothetical protein
MTKKIIIILIAFTFIFGCKDKKKDLLMPPVSGMAGEVVLVIDGKQWASDVGNEYKKIFLKEFPALPQAEPYFNLIHISSSAFSRIFKLNRDIVIVKIAEKFKEPKIIIQNNLWAKPQTIVNVVAPDDSTMATLVREKGDIIIDRLLKAEKERLVNNYKKYEKKEIRERLNKKFAVSMVVPKGYSIATDTSNFVWLSKEEPELSQGIFVYSYRKDADINLTTNFLVSKRNDFLEKYVPGQIIGSYMQTETQFEPFLRKIPINNKEVSELRGLWKVENDFMGGPFISFSIFNPKNNRVVCADAFVYAPKLDKRNYVRQLEAILSTLKLKD